MRLRYTQPALADLAAILDYVSTHSPQGASRIHARIDAIANLLVSHPRIGTQTDDPTIRRVNTSPYPYLIFYEIFADEVVIHAVRHGARDPAGMPDAV
jgi:toxin ParE1/3/4